MSAITGTTRLACLLGSPVSHSISPLIHNFSFQYLGIDCAYLAFDINEQNLKEAVEGLKALHVLGFNLTMPNKNKILEYLDDLSDAARLIGVILEDEKAYHTVHIAFGTNVGFGGANQADCHMDGVIRNPTLYLDDILVMKDGEFQI